MRQGVLELLTGIRTDVERLDQLSREQADFFPRVSDVVQGLHEYVRVSLLVDLRLIHEVFCQRVGGGGSRMRSKILREKEPGQASQKGLQRRRRRSAPDPDSSEDTEGVL